MPEDKKEFDPTIEDVEGVVVEEDSKRHPIQDALNAYIQHIDSLYKTLFLTMFTINRTYKKAEGVLKDFEKQNCQVSDSDQDGHYTVVIKENYIRRWTRLHRDLNQIVLSSKLVPASFLASFISQYDAFLGHLIKALFDIIPDVLNSSERNLSYSQLAEFESISEARAHIVEKEIETVLRKSHSEQFEWLEKKFELPLRKDLALWPLFIEVTERRNLFVHTRGIVSSQYIKICKQHGVKLSDDIKVGGELDASLAYMEEAYECLFDIGVQLAHVLWRKKDAKTRVLADESLNSIAYELLLDEKYSLAIKVLDFAVNTVKKFSSEQIRRMIVVNRALAYKWSENEKTAAKIIHAEDWTATSDNFRLAEAVILEEYTQADILVEKIGNKGSVTANNYREWPLFIKYRKREEFKKVFNKVFGEDISEMEQPVSEVLQTDALDATQDTDIKS